MDIQKNIITEPPFCVRPTCKYFKKKPPPDWYDHNGFHDSKAHGVVPRFICKECGKTFSTQTFSIDYFTKRRLDWKKFEQILTSRASDRAMARSFGVAPAAIQNRINRLSKAHIASHTKILNATGLRENLVADGFETFSLSQYYPCHVTLAVGSESQTAFSWAYAPLRRKGRMTQAQVKKREVLEAKWKPDPKAVEKSFTSAVIKPLHALMSQSNIKEVSLITDQHPAYARAVAKDKLVVNSSEEWNYDHQTINSKRPRTRDNPLFPINYMDREIRKDLGNHVRETVTFARNPNDMMNRITVELSSHNLNKRFRENDIHLKNFHHWTMAAVEWPELIYVWERIHSWRPWRDPGAFGDDFLMIWDRNHPSPMVPAKRYRAQFWDL